jgi:hypothetical protein
MNLGDLPIEVAGTYPLAEQFQSAHLGLDQAATVTAAPALPDAAPR